MCPVLSTCFAHRGAAIARLAVKLLTIEFPPVTSVSAWTRHDGGHSTLYAYKHRAPLSSSGFEHCDRFATFSDMVEALLTVICVEDEESPTDWRNGIEKCHPVYVHVLSLEETSPRRPAP